MAVDKSIQLQGGTGEITTSQELTSALPGWWEKLQVGLRGVRTCWWGAWDTSPHQHSRWFLHRLGAGMTQTAVATSKPMSSRLATGRRWAELGPLWWDITAGTAGDRNSQHSPFPSGFPVRPAEKGKSALRRAQAAGVHTDHCKWDLILRDHGSPDAGQVSPRGLGTTQCVG